ncbi:hypothetical protein FB595_114118 [Sphingobium sp. AEW010]|nr:hypothetical protein FB595_114118 [Sphingobium sp. AEW010]TWD20867.1 hypothetical protein FB596_1142 [Sphingobium sp. AEW013]TWD23642.1 hypothetical protein FB594_1142 [Sphingobium sp. AEW001]
MGMCIAASATMGLFTACTAKPLPILIEKYCVSDSGLSKYWLTLNTSDKTGAIRYQYMGQDVRYVVKTMQINGNEIGGRADFQASATGEIRGTPITFIYDDSIGTFKDGNAGTSCQNKQPAEHISSPPPAPAAQSL